jgi:7-cyano-7-deazaguanine synthase
MNTKAVVLFSGGQDSTTVLGKALSLGLEVYALGFDYGQRHQVELQQATEIADQLEVPYKIIDITDFGKLVTTGLTKTGDDLSKPHERMASVPASFVPNRNALMLTIAHAYAQEVGADSVWGGMCQTDYSGYPDCRDEFIRSLETTLNLGYKTNISFVTPLMFLDKAQTFKLAESLDILDLVVTMSNTCYNGDRSKLHHWGFGCGECPACKLRENGWNKFINEQVPL